MFQKVMEGHQNERTLMSMSRIFSRGFPLIFSAPSGSSGRVCGFIAVFGPHSVDRVREERYHLPHAAET